MGSKKMESKVKELEAEERVVSSEEKKVTEERVVNVRRWKAKCRKRW